ENSQTAVSAAGRSRPGSPTASALLARPVKPPAARSRHSPSGSSTWAGQASAQACSRRVTLIMSVCVPATGERRRMNISRRDDRHNADLAKEISDSFNRAIGEKRERTDQPGDGNDESQDAGEQQAPRFVVTGDKRDTGRRPRR